jgi:hypothetical protein
LRKVEMRDRWYADNRDLVKWGVLLRLADSFGVSRILQLAFYRPSEFGKLVIEGEEHDIPEEVIAHFRDLRTISSIESRVRITVFDSVFRRGHSYLERALSLIQAYSQERCIIILDPDTGLESKRPGLEHVLNDEARQVWDVMKTRDVFVLYQHQTNRAGQPWIDPKREQLAQALGIKAGVLRMAQAPDIARDIVLFFAEKA